MEAYPGDPYAYMPADGGGKKIHSLEGTLPLILIIVIAFFVLQFLGVTPCVIPLGCGAEASVLVIGAPSQDLVTTLSGKEAQLKGIHYPINLDPDFITIDVLKNYQVVILQGDPEFNMETREAVKDYVDGGGKIIVVGDAGSKHPELVNVEGWGWPAGQGIPVPADLVYAESGSGETSISYGENLRIVDNNHPIVKGIKPIGAKLISKSEVQEVTAKGNVIVAIEITSTQTVPAIIEGGSGFGNVIYFAYDPGRTPEILLTTVNYLAGI